MNATNRSGFEPLAYILLFGISIAALLIDFFICFTAEVPHVLFSFLQLAIKPFQVVFQSGNTVLDAGSFFE